MRCSRRMNVRSHLDKPISDNGLDDPYSDPTALVESAISGHTLAAGGGGIAYTGGVAFHAAERVRYSHFVLHLLVVLGTTCHFFAVLRYAA
jgi:hypothetical protein